jgi:5-methylcytosine-specific restriction endonuclease McrA
LDKDFVCEDIAVTLRISSGSAAEHLWVARELARMPHLLDLLRRGEMNVQHARVAARQTLLLSDEQVEAFVERVAADALVQSVGQFARSCQRAALAVGADPAQKRTQAYCDRRVASRPAGDGMGELYGFLSAADLAAMMTRLDIEARKASPGDERTVEQKRADALVAFVLGEMPPAPTVNVVTVAESTLAGRNDEPAELARFGSITAEHARELASTDGVRFRVFTTDSTGRLLDCGEGPNAPAPGYLLDYDRSTYTPPAALDRYIRARDVTCRFPGCTYPAKHADIDHIIGWADGGPTAAWNLQVLCKRHHHLKHESDWRVHRRPDGTTVWTHLGRTYDVAPHRYRVSGPDPPLPAAG